MMYSLQDDEHDAEDWERFESLHDDVDKQVNTYNVDNVLCVCSFDNNNRGEQERDYSRRSRR